MAIRARLHGYAAAWFEDKWDRSTTYRKNWLEGQPDQIQRCVYCGRKIPTKSLTVDHVIPVSAVKRSRFARWLMKSRNIDDINDQRNLTGACFKCNEKKGDSFSIVWLIKARMGKYDWWWYLVYLFRFALIAGVAYVLFLLFTQGSKLGTMLGELLRKLMTETGGH